MNDNISEAATRGFQEAIEAVLKHLHKEQRAQSMSEDFADGYEHAIWQIKRQFVSPPIKIQQPGR